MAKIEQRDALAVLTKPRLVAIAGALGLELPAQLLKADIVDAIAGSPRAPFPRILDLLKRDELKAICRAANLDDSGGTKARIAGRILGRRPEGGMATLTKADLVRPSGSATSGRAGRCSRSSTRRADSWKNHERTML